MIYLDNSATTEISAAAKNKMIEAMGIYGNPSSTHLMGIEARRMIDSAREKLASALGAGHIKAENLIFTASGTEANNLAMIGMMTAKARNKGKKIIVGETEHPSVIETAKHLV